MRLLRCAAASVSFCCSLMLVLSLRAGNLASAAEMTVQHPHLVATNFGEVDDDFAYQGEYFGPLPMTLSGVQATIGLQVVARGGGEFIASEFYGGLPGYGVDTGDHAKLKGHRDGDRLILSGSGHRFLVSNGEASLLDARGKPLGSIVKVNRISVTMGQNAPPEAIVLFDGTNTERWINGHILPDGTLEEGAMLKDVFRDYYLHLEFQLSYMPYARGQGRSNSGVYLQNRYEVQILDSFGLQGDANECGGLYRFQRPEINMCLPPLAWQTYDIEFRSPRFDPEGKKIENAHVSLWQNGYRVQNDLQLLNKTGHGRPESPQLLPILLQHHGNPVHFRNIWLVDRDQALRGYGYGPDGFRWRGPAYGNFARPPHLDYWLYGQ